MVGGELTLEMLDLTFNPMSKFYEAPIQLKANGGVFLVDDFGRQRVRPRSPRRRVSRVAATSTLRASGCCVRSFTTITGPADGM